MVVPRPTPHDLHPLLRQDGACGGQHGFVHHLALEAERAVALRGGVVRGGEQGAGALRLGGGRAEQLVRQFDLRGVDAQLPGVAQRVPVRRPRGSGPGGSGRSRRCPARARRSGARPAPPASGRTGPPARRACAAHPGPWCSPPRRSTPTARRVHAGSRARATPRRPSPGPPGSAGSGRRSPGRSRPAARRPHAPVSARPPRQFGRQDVQVIREVRRVDGVHAQEHRQVRRGGDQVPRGVPRDRAGGGLRLGRTGMASSRSITTASGALRGSLAIRSARFPGANSRLRGRASPAGRPAERTFVDMPSRIATPTRPARLPSRPR